MVEVVKAIVMGVKLEVIIAPAIMEEVQVVMIVVDIKMITVAVVHMVTIMINMMRQF